MTGGHGHVTPRPDRGVARCGGPRICKVCSKELADLITIPGLTVEVIAPGDLRVTRADQTLRIPLALLRAAPSSVLALMNDTVRIVWIYYQVTGWDPATNSLICNRIHTTALEAFNSVATPAELIADRDAHAAEMRQVAADALAAAPAAPPRESPSAERTQQTIDALAVLDQVPTDDRLMLLIKARVELGSGPSFDDMVILAAARASQPYEPDYSDKDPAL